MSLFIPCSHCNAEFKLPDTVVIRQSEGAIVTLRCRACQGRIVVKDLELDFEPTPSLLSTPPPPPAPIPKSIPAPPPHAEASSEEFESVQDEELEEDEAPAPETETAEEPTEEPLALVRRTVPPPPIGELDALVSVAPRAKRQSRLPAPPKAPSRLTGALPPLPALMVATADEEQGPQSTTPRLSDLAKHSGRVSNRPPPPPVNLEFSGLSALMTPNPALLGPTMAPVSIDARAAEDEFVEDAPASSKSMPPALAPQSGRRGSPAMTIAITAAAAVVAYFGVRQLAEITAPPSTSTKPTAVAAAPVPAARPAAVITEHSEPSAVAASSTPAPVAVVASASAPASAAPRSEKPAPDQAPATPALTTAAATAVAATPATPAEAAPAAKPIDQTLLKAALNEAAARAVSCKQPGDPVGPATVVVTFAPSGRATRAVISGGPFAGTSTGGCIANAMRTASVTPFSGDLVNVRKTVAIE